MSKFMNEIEAGKLLSAYKIPIVESIFADGMDSLMEAEKNLKYPVVMKILSPDIIHKTDAGCVAIGIRNKEQLISSYEKIMKNGRAYSPDAVIDGVIIQEMAEHGIEVIVGMKKDPQFGNIIMVGTGGIYVEVHKDIALRLLPIERYDGIEMLKETKIYEIMNGARDKYYDLDAIIDVLMKISLLAQENSSIEEIDINPFFLYEKGKGGIGVDALIKFSENFEKC